ncbi:MAG: hypothetical protein KF895_11585 [Parvibaculum sp.]|nr:hypothetical protein [Parvibaculum sp.]
MELGKAVRRFNTNVGKCDRSRFVARIRGSGLQSLGHGLAAAKGFARMTGGLRRLMRRVMSLIEMRLMRGGSGLMRGSVARTGQGAREQDACKIEDREL